MSIVIYVAAADSCEHVSRHSLSSSIGDGTMGDAVFQFVRYCQRQLNHSSSSPSNAWLCIFWFISASNEWWHTRPDGYTPIWIEREKCLVEWKQMSLSKITGGRAFGRFIRLPIDWVSGLDSAIESCSTSPINSLASQCVCLPNDEPHQKRQNQNRYQKLNSIAWSRGGPQCCRNKWHSHSAVFLIKMANKSVIRCFCFVYWVCAIWCESIAPFLLLLHSSYVTGIAHSGRFRCVMHRISCLLSLHFMATFTTSIWCVCSSPCIAITLLAYASLCHSHRVHSQARRSGGNFWILSRMPDTSWRPVFFDVEFQFSSLLVLIHSLNNEHVSNEIQKNKNLGYSKSISVTIHI